MINKKIKTDYDALVIGSGIGGLLAAAFLSKKGYKTCVLERLSFYGGKFTAFNYRGYQIPSGAFHMIPAAEKGGLGRCFTELGLDIEYIHPRKAAAVFLEGGKRYPLYNPPVKNILARSYLWRFTLKEIAGFSRFAYNFLRGRDSLPDMLFNDFLKRYTESRRIETVFNQMMSFANGTDIHRASLVEFRQSVRSIKNNSEALVKGGCGHLTGELVRSIEQNGGELYKKTKVERIEFDKDSRATGAVLIDGRTVTAKIIVSNAGPRATRALLGRSSPAWLNEKIEGFKPVAGISYSIGTGAPLLKHDAIEIPMDYRNICGYVQASNLDPALAPPGRHLLLAAQMVPEENRRMKDAIKEGVSELLKIFPCIAEENIINISSFHKGWAAAPTGQLLGQTGGQRYPLRVRPWENLFMISHDSAGYGFAADVIGNAALAFREMI